MNNTVPTSWKMCVTCSNYCGNVRPDAFCNNVTFDNDERGLCAHYRIPYPPMAGACQHYRSRF